MGLTSSLNSALAGLDLTSRRADLVSRNVANADAPGYARRELEGSGPAGLPGSQVSVARPVDPRLVQLRRESQSREAGAAVPQALLAELDGAVGDPGTPGSLQDAIARLDASLVAATAHPNAPTRLTDVALAAEGLAAKLRSIDAVVQDGRQRADTGIGRTVDQLNADLRDVEKLNVDIRRVKAGGNDAADLIDRRTVLIDRISKAVPVREMPREGGAVALVSEGGLLLLDGKALTLGFTAHSPITADMTAPSTLSGLTVNGLDVPTQGASSGIRGGALEALFHVRDTLAPETTAMLDGMAGDLVLRFEAAGAVGGTPGAAGLFTDAGAPFAAGSPPGLAGRLSLNAAVPADRPDLHFRLRDGLGATGPGSGSDVTLLLRYGEALARPGLPLAGGLPARQADLPGHAADLRSMISQKRVAAEDEASQHRTRSEELAARRDGAGVDIDAEMRRLIDVEQAYAANARVLQAVSDMMNRLTEI